MTRALTAYWWSPQREARAYASAWRRFPAAWPAMARFGGRGVTNFGDELTPIVLEALTARRVMWAPADRAEVFAIGSVLDTYEDVHASALVLGSGRRTAAVSTPPNPQAVLAVRGPLTREACRLSRFVPLGDPGLVVRELWRPPRAKSIRALLIPHFSEFASRAGRREISAARRIGFDVCPPAASPRQVCVAIGSAQRIFASSLHGIIVAHALGVPATWLDFGTGREPAFKFDDYAQSVGIELPRLSWRSFVSGVSAGGPNAWHDEESNRAVELAKDRIDSLLAGLYKAAERLR